MPTITPMQRQHPALSGLIPTCANCGERVWFQQAKCPHCSAEVKDPVQGVGGRILGSVLAARADLIEDAAVAMNRASAEAILGG